MSESNPAWSHDGKYLFFSQPNGDIGRVAWRNADASGGEAHTLLPSGDAPSLTADGHRMVFNNVRDLRTHFDIWTAPVTYGPDGPKAGEPRPVLQTPGLDLFPHPSPALVIAWLTVSFQTWRVARAKPMTALRYE